MSNKKLAGVVAVLAVAAMAIAGCSGGSSDSGSSGGTGESSALQEQAQAKVAEFEAGPTTYPGPTETFNPGSGRAAVLACGFTAAICAEQGRYAVEAVQAMGWQSGPLVDGQFSPQVQAAFVDRAVQDRVDGIVIVSVDVRTISASIDRAIAARMPIVCVQCVSGPQYRDKGVVDVTSDFVDQGNMAAWKILAESGEDAKVLTFVDKAFESTVERAEGLETTLKENCPDCSFEAINFPTTSNGKPGPPEFSAALAQNPKGTLTNVVGHYDGMGMAVTKTAQQSGRTEIGVGSYDGSEENLAALVSGSPPLDFTVAEPYTYATWGAVDLMARIKAGVPLWEGHNSLPNTLITENNAQTYLNGNPAPSVFPAPQGDWQGNFKKLWGTA